MNAIRRRHSIHGTTVTSGISWGILPADHDDSNNSNDDDDASIDFEAIIAQPHNNNEQSKAFHRFSQSEKYIQMNHNHNHNHSLRNIGTSMISKMNSSTSKIRNIAHHVVTKSVNKVRLPSITTGTNNTNQNNGPVGTSKSPHKLKQKYHEMMSSSGDLSLACTNIIEKSDDNVSILMSPENTTLMQKLSNHTGTTRNMTLEDESDNDLDVDDMYHDAEPLLMIHSDRHHPTGKDNFRTYVQMDCHPNQNSMTGGTMVVQSATTPISTTPTPFDRIVDELFHQQQQQQQQQPAQFGSDHQPMIPTTVYQKNNKVTSSTSQRVSPRALRKFRMVGILEDSLEEYQPKVEPICIRVTDVLPNSPKNSPTPFGTKKHKSRDEVNDTTPGNQGISSVSGGRTTKLRRVRSVRGGRRTDLGSSFKSLSSLPSTVASKSHHHRPRVHPKDVLDRMTFGPASKHHCRRQSQRSLLVSNYQNLLINIDPDHCTERQKSSSSHRLESKLGMMKPTNDFDLPISVQRRKQAKMKSPYMDTTKTILPSARQIKATTPSRARIQFDFNPKNLNELCQAIDQAKIQNGSGHTESLLSTDTKSPVAKSSTIVLIQPMI